jgi:LPXTG-motif cell wall-anchored protein
VTDEGVDVPLAPSRRRALGLLAATTIGLSTVLLGGTGVAQAAPTLVPQAPEIVAIDAAATSLVITFDANHPPADDLDTADADSWEYQLDGGSWEPVVTPEVDPPYVSFEVTGLVEGQPYDIRVRGVDADLGAGGESAAETAVPFVAWPRISGWEVNTVATWNNLELFVNHPPSSGPATFPLAGYVITLEPADGSGTSFELCVGPTETIGMFGCSAPVPPGVDYWVTVAPVDTEGYLGEASAPVRTGVVPFPMVVPASSGTLTAPAEASQVSPGETVNLSGSGYESDSTVVVSIYSQPQLLTTTLADSTGSFTATATIPADLLPGAHTLVASGSDGSGGVRHLTLEVMVTDDGAVRVGAAKRLAATGADVTVPAIGGLAALALGVGLITVSRRRRAA